MLSFPMFLRVSTLCLVIMASLPKTRANPVKAFLSVQKSESGRIINGTTSKVDWPFMVSIVKILTNGSRRSFCGGTICDEDTILTAAHCFLNDMGFRYFSMRPFRVYLSHSNLDHIDPNYIFKVKSMILHPGFNATGRINDIGIIKLDGKIELGREKHKKASCLCAPEPLALLNKSACITMGWGLTSQAVAANIKNLRLSDIPAELQQIQVSIHSDSLCGFFSKTYSSEKKICAGADNVANCFGDSGGPLVCPVKAYPLAYSQVGVFAHGNRLCKSRPAQFTRVEHFVGWIEETAGRGRSTTAERVPASSLAGDLIEGCFFLVGAIAVGVLLGLILRQSTSETGELEETKKKTPSTSKSTMISPTLTSMKKPDDK